MMRSGDFPAGGTFVGTYTHSLDSKKRLTIPSEWREVAGEPRLFVLPGVDLKCLYVFPANEMMRRLEKFRTVSIADVKAQQFARTFFSRANQVPWDSQGRLRVSDDLLEYADLLNQVVLVGIGNRFELWSPEKWKEQNTRVEPAAFVEAAQYIGF
ncbi:MAG: division/cell wall cluster transcriptional repressor MraZ [Lentisphaerota bacterium]